MKIAVVSVLACLSGGVSAFIAPPADPTLTRLFTRKPFITGNWKLNPSTRQEAVDLATGIADSITSESPCDVALFVPFPFIDAVSEAVGGKLIVGAEVCCVT
jgi:triosephosphate isomerase (TIM)